MDSESDSLSSAGKGASLVGEKFRRLGAGDSLNGGSIVDLASLNYASMAASDINGYYSKVL